jgi:outer membrane protein assembly factor BamB
MASTINPRGVKTRKYKLIFRTVAVRVLVYTALFLIVAVLLVDFRSLPLRGSAGSRRSEENFPSNSGWPHFRGPGYDAHSDETELANTWPPDGPPVLWTSDIGAGYSGMIAQGGRVYTQTQALTEQKVLALEADTGHTIWEHGCGWPYQAGGMFAGPRATPTLAHGRIYFVSPTGLVGCLDEVDGHPLWSINVREKFDGRGAGFGYACSPVVEDGKVILPVGGSSASVVALDANTGATRWTSGSASASYSSALPITFHGRRQVAVFLQNTLAGFDLRTGRLLWEQAYPRGFEEHAAALLYDEPYLRAFQAYRAGSDLYELEAGAPEGSNDGVPSCRIKRVRHDAQMSNDIASGVLVNGFLYGFDLREMQATGGRPSRGTFRCLDFKTGQVRWSSDQPGQASMVAADGKLLMLNDRGQALLVRINPDRYEELGRADVFPGETCWTAPALYSGRLYLRSPSRAACLFVGKPERMSLNQRALAAHLSAAPKLSPTDVTWLVGADREYPFELPDWRELTRWYFFSLFALIAAALLAGITSGILRFFRGHWSRLPVAIVFWSGLYVFGIIATPVANRFSTQFVFTWPLSLIAAHQIALAAVSRSKQREPSKKADWLGTAAAGFLILTCLVYFKLTRQLHLAPAWYFLLALPAAWPIAVPAARRLRRAGKLASDILWLFAVFSVYFWVSGGVMLLRTARFTIPSP